MDPSTPHTSPRRRWRALTTGAIAASVVVAGLAAAAPSTANGFGVGGGTGTFSAGSGIVGVPQVVTFSLSNPSIPPGSVTIVATGSASSQPVNAATVNFSGGAAQGTFAWTPPHVGTWTFCAVSFTCTGSTFINQVGTTVAVTAPNTVRLGQQTTITATVSSQSGSILAPLGQVQFAIVGGGNFGAPVWLNGANPSTATINWTPGTLGAVQWTATYIPNVVNGVSDTTCGANCTSPVDTVQVTTTGVNFFLSNPGTLSAGVSATLQAVVSVVPPTGAVTFTINGAPIATGVGVNAQGIAQTAWTPPAAGTYSLAAFWTGNGGQTGTSTETLTVVPAPAQSDNIVVRTANGTVLNPATPFSAQNGTSATFSTQTSSGAAAVITEAGPCTINGTTVTVTQGNGQCRITASSPGGNGYGPASATYVINLTPGTQSPVGTIRASGNIPRNTNITLATRANNVTNAGQRMRWRVTSGGNVCRITYPSNGSVRLRATRAGSCNVRATAPAIAGQWNNMVVNRSYRAR